MIHQKSFTLLQNSVYPLSFDTCYKMYWPCMNKHRLFQMVMSKMICAEWEFKGSNIANGVCQVSEQRDMLKRHSSAFLLSLLSCFFCLDSLFWHGLASLNLVISTQHNGTPLFCANRFWHAWVWIVPFHSYIEISLCVWYQMKEEKILLIMKHIVCFDLAWQRRYLTKKTGFLFCGTHCIRFICLIANFIIPIMPK